MWDDLISNSRAGLCAAREAGIIINFFRYIWKMLDKLLLLSESYRKSYV